MSRLNTVRRPSAVLFVMLRRCMKAGNRYCRRGPSRAIVVSVCSTSRLKMGSPPGLHRAPNGASIHLRLASKSRQDISFNPSYLTWKGISIPTTSAWHLPCVCVLPRKHTHPSWAAQSTKQKRYVLLEMMQSVVVVAPRLVFVAKP